MPILPPRTVTWRTAGRKKNIRRILVLRDFLAGRGKAFFFLFQGVYLDFQIDSFQLRAECFCMDILLDSKITRKGKDKSPKILDFFLKKILLGGDYYLFCSARWT